MTPAELTAYLRTNIPLTGAMEVSAIRVEPETVVLEAPLAPNINHRKTVFGGSASSLAILAAWSLVHLRLAETRLDHRLVIQRNTMSYDAPIEGTFTATARFAEGTDWAKFLDTLGRRGKARIGAIAELSYEGRLAGRLEADFVAILVS
jgi:thioesterase domain-containing protein